MIKGMSKKVYIGNISTEHRAAKLYDYVAILVKGYKANTNFKYTARDVQTILDSKDQ